MRKFRLISEDDAYKPLFFGEVYEGGLVPTGWGYNVASNALCNPEDWEEVFEEEEQEQKSPEQYYAGQNNILSISGTFGDVVFSLSGNFEKCLTILDFISTLEVEKK